MSVRVFFSFSTGILKPIKAPRGTLQRLLAHVEEVEATLGLTRERYADNPIHWGGDAKRLGFPGVDDELLCKTVAAHNAWARQLYDDIERWQRDPPAPEETITPEDAAKFWHALEDLNVSPERWTAEYYRKRMEHAYEVMRGRESEGVDWNGKPLTPKQAGGVIWLFEHIYGGHGLDLEVPRGCDQLLSSYDGGYDWCERCGAVLPEDGQACRKRKCPIRQQDGE